MSRRLILMAMAAGAMLGAYGKSFTLDLRGPGTGGAKVRLAASSQTQGDGTLRSFDLGAGVADVGEVAVGDELTFALFDDVALVLTLKEKMPSPLGGDAFLAEVAGYEGIRSAVVLRTSDGLTIDVQDFLKDRVYKVMSTPSGVKVREIKPLRGGRCGCDTLSPAALGGMQPAASESVEGSSTGARGLSRRLMSPMATDTCVDVLVAYDKNAATWAKSDGGGLTNFAQTAVQKMNYALANTGLDEKFRFRLVGIVSVSASTDNLNTALNAATGGTSGWGAIKAKRDEVGADIVTVLIDTGSAYGTTGLGWSLMITDFASFSENAYNVCAIRSVAQSHTMTHEVGHNMGCGHSDKMADRANCGPQLYNYSAGYYITEWFPVEEGSTWSSEKKLHTIMAYDDNGYGEIYEEIPYFSSAEKQYTCNGKSVVVGDETHDNTRTLENTYAAVAKWRAQKVPMTYDVQFSPVSGTIFAESITVRISSQKEGAEIRYTLDGSEPTTASPIYSGPIELTESAKVRAVVVVDGVCGIASSADYIKADIGAALGLPDNVWTVSTYPEWHVDTDESLDGMSIRADITEEDSVVWVQTTIEGPCTLSFKTHGNSSKGFDYHLSCDEDELFEHYAWGIDCNWESTPYYVEIPEGAHTVRFWARFYDLPQDEETSFWLDSFRIYRVAEPFFVPGTTSDFENATMFDEELRVAIECADSAAKIYYTLDGSNPEGNEALEYDGPFYVTNTITVRAVARLLGENGQSAPVQGIFRRRHVFDSQVGRWTGDVAGAFAAAEGGGRMVALLCMNYAGCWWSQRLEPILRDASFLAWAKANGVYLVNTDPGWLDGDAADEYVFWNLYSGSSLSTELYGYVYYPTFCFAAPDNRNSCLGAMLARNDGEHMTNGIAFDDTPESLVSCFASMLGKSPLYAPVATVAGSQVTLVNPNGTGTIYYSLGDAVPTRESGLRYNGAAIAVPKGERLTAVVWPDDADGVSGFPLVYEEVNLEENMGVFGMTWENDVGTPWTLEDGSAYVEAVEVSRLVARVHSAGVISFETGWGYSGTLELSVNGTVIKQDCGSYEQIIHEITDSAGAEITWKFTPSSWYSEPYASFYNLTWTPLPDAPCVRAEVGSGRYGTLIRWDAVYGATKYLVFRASVNDSGASVKVGESTQCRYWDADSKDGTKYWYWVKTVNNYGESDFSAGVQAGVGRVTVSFDPNGGQGTMAAISVVPDVAQPLPANRFDRPDHVFAGWAERADGDVVFADGQAVAFSAKTTLYAKWDLRQVLGNDTFAKAVEVSGGGGRVYGTNRGASVTAGEFLKKEYGSDHTVWFKWTAPSSGLLRLEITDADFDTVLGVFTGGSASSLTWVADDDDGGGYGGLSAASLDVAAGVTYYIVVGGYESEAGDFFLDWEFFDESNLVSVRFDAAGGAVKPDNMRCMPGTAIGTLPWPERQYHRFEGWFTSPVGGDAVYQSWIVPEGGTTLYAHWTELLHWHTDSASAFAEAKSTGRLIFFLGGRETCGNTIGTRDYTCEEPEVRAALGEYVLWFCNCDTQGQDFWRYASGSGSVELPYVCVINPYTNVSLVSSQGYLNAEDVFALLAAAGPAPGLRTVVFDANGGKVDEPERSVQPGGAVGALPVPTREKYKFLGWFTEAEGGAKVAATTKVSEDVTYYAHWEYDGSAMVTVKIAEGCEAMGKVSGGNATFKAGDKVSLKATANSGCVFVGWRVGDGAVASQVASWSYVATGEPVTIMALFATAEDDAASLKVAVEDQMVGSDGTLSYDIGACVESLTPAKLAVSGLPSGLKFDSKTTVISGQATKPGVYTVKVTATNTSSKKGIEKTFEIKVPNLLPELFKEAGLEDSYRCWGGVAPESLSGVISKVKAGGWKLALSGLPSGLKYDDAKGTIAGVATKEVSSTVYFTATKDKEKQIATATFEVVFPTLTLKMEAHDGGGAKGKVSGDGSYPKGKKVTLKATPDSGCVFVGWREEGSTDFLSQAASYSYEMSGDDVTFVAVFATTKQDAANVALSVNGAAMSSTSGGKPATTNILCGVAVNWPLAVTALSATTVKVAGLPAGMKFADKPVTSKVGSGKTAVVVTNVPANTIYGAPTAASKVDAKKGVVPSDVKVTVTTAGKTVVTYAMSVTVDPLPAWAVGNFEGAAGNGAATMSVTAAGKVSGKVSLAGTNWTFKADSYAAAESAGAQTNFVVAAEAVSGKATMPVELSLSGTALDYLPGSATACAEGAFGGSAARLCRLVWADKGDAVAAGQVATYAGAYSFTAAYGSKTGDVAFTLDEKGVAKGAVALPDGAKTRKATFSANALPCEDGLHVVVALAPDAKKGYLAVFEDRILVAHSGERADGYAFRDPGVVLSVGERTEGSGAAGTVSANPKYGQVAAGKDVTLTAKADKDSVFYRWEIDPASPADGKDLSDPTLKLRMDGGGDVRAKAVFVTKEEDAANIALSVNGAALSGSPTTNVFCGVAVNWPVAVTALSKTAVKVSGLPSGLKFTDKGVLKKGSKTEYDVLPNTIYGAPTAASKVDAKKGVVPSEVKITVTTAGKTTKTYAMSVTVDPLPAWAVGTFDGAEFGYRDGAVAVEDVSGLVQGLAVAANGKISGKVLRSDGTWTFSADSFASYDAGSGMYLAVVVAKNGKAAATNVLAVTSHKVDGADQGVVTVMGGGEAVQMAWQSPWKAEPWKTTAKDFAKAPALAIGEVTLKFASSGVVTAAGKFVTGKDAKDKDVVYSASCSSPLLPQGKNGYLAVLYFPPKKDAKGNVTFAGYSALVPLSWDAEAKAFSLVPEE